MPSSPILQACSNTMSPGCVRWALNCTPGRDPRSLLPPRRPVYWPNNSGSALELDSRNERNQLGPLCKSVASSWNCKIGFEIPFISVKEIDVIRGLKWLSSLTKRDARLQDGAGGHRVKALGLALPLRSHQRLAQVQEPGSACSQAGSRRGVGPVGRAAGARSSAQSSR